LIVRRLTGLGMIEPAGTGQLLNRLAQGPARIGDLAQMSRCHMSVSSRLVSELEAHGLVGRIADPLDGRSHLVRLTGAGRAYLDRYNTEIGRLIGTALDGWNPVEVSALVAQLERLNDGIDAALAEQPVSV
jgi:DNA-binding MarR family transcriptional regulator